MTEVSKAEFARHMGLSKARVTQLTKTGAPLANAMLERGRLDLETAAALYETYRHPGRGPTKPPAELGQNSNEVNGAAPWMFQEYRGRREKAQAELAELKLRQATGRLIDRNHVREALIEAGLRIGGEIDRMPDLTDEILACARQGDAAALRSLLRDKARKIREAVVERLAVPGDGGDEIDGEDESEGAA